MSLSGGGSGSGLLRIQLAFFGFNMAEFATWVAILVHAFGHGGAAMAGLVAFVQLVPAGFVAPFAAFAGDRFPRRRVLFAGYLAQALSIGVTAIALAIDAPALVVYGCATIVTTTITFTRPTQYALLPEITGTPEELSRANAGSGVAEGLGMFVGPLVAGVLLAGPGPAAVFALFAGLSLAGAVLVVRLGVARGPAAPPAIDALGVVSEILAGFRLVRREPKARLIVLVLVALPFVSGALDVLFVTVAIDLLHEGEGWAGYLNAAYGLGAIGGASLAIALVGRRRLGPALAGGAVLYGGPVALVGVAPFASVALAGFVVSGGGRSLAAVAGNTLLQRVAPDELRSRVFGILEGLGMFALALGSIAASSLITTAGIGAALVATGLCAPLAVALAWIPLRSIEAAARVPDEEALTLLRRLPIFAPLSAPAMEAVLAGIFRLEVPAGTVLIREGDVGDRFYVIAEGDVAVSRLGGHLADRHAGDYVGEIALLRDVPRTATVTATTPLRLLVLERDAFLEAVTGQPQARERAEAVVAERLRL